MIIYTIGHGNRNIEEFIKILKYYDIELVVDVRRFPTSKKFPWFSINELSERLMKENINYVWLGEELGGYRKEGYENYIRSEKFKEGINKIEELSKSKILAIMCSEKLWFKCHRRFIANILVEKGYEVIHIFDEKKKQKHKL
ncbi:MAG: DUF488 domain-containing protein [Candidatus Methanomethylicia archaeon]|nr:DUF488 domain-containing protein [Candidatus Methanomethylicia archaeon]